MKYDGKIKLAECRENVRLVDDEAELSTEFLDFDLNDNIGYYFNGGTIVNDENILKSIQGYYYSDDKLFFFKDSVLINNPKYDIISDTLKYSTVSRISYFFGPTEIISDENYIYCENGWYNTTTDICQFNKNAYLENKNQLIKGDSLYYERNTGHGRAFENVEIIDTANNVTLKGNFASYYEQPESSLLTDSTLCIYAAGEDSLYIHSDTLRYNLDSLGEKVIRGYYDVRIFRSNLQGLCDSLVYTLRDSTISLFTEPIVWSGKNQMTSAHIKIHTKEGNIDFVEMLKNAFIVLQEDTAHYNQVKGKDMVGYFKDNDLYKIDVNGNGQTIYYPKDRDAIIGLNKAASSNLVIFLDENEVKKINFLSKPVANLLPLEDPKAKEDRLSGFQWLDVLRPRNVMDLFKEKEEVQGKEEDPED